MSLNMSLTPIKNCDIILFLFCLWHTVENCLISFEILDKIDVFLCTLRSLMKLLICLSREDHECILKSCPNGMALI